MSEQASNVVPLPVPDARQQLYAEVFARALAECEERERERENFRAAEVFPPRLRLVRP